MILRRAGLTAAVAAALAICAISAPPSSFAAQDIFFFHNSGIHGPWFDPAPGNSLWDNAWGEPESCPGDGGEFMDTYWHHSWGATVLIPSGASPALLTHTYDNVTRSYRSGTWRVRLNLTSYGVNVSSAKIKVVLYFENGDPSSLCSGITWKGEKSITLNGVVSGQTVFDIVAGSLNIDNKRLAVGISQVSGSGNVYLSFGTSGANPTPCQLESTNYTVSFAAPGAEVEALSLEETSWGAIKHAFGDPE